MREPEGSPRRHGMIAKSVIAFFWSPDGSKLLFFQPGFAVDGKVLVYEVSLHIPGTGETRRIAVIRSAVAQGMNPFFSPQ